MYEKHLDHIEFKRIRPRIKVATSKTPDTLFDIISDNLNDNKYKIEGKVLPNFITIYPPHEEQHYWSPQLTVTIEQLETGSLISGLYGPQPSVWTMFIFFYSFIGFVTLIVSLIGLSFISLDKNASILWFVPILIIIFLTLYLVAYLGQKFGHRQMIYLHHFMEECLGKKIEAI
tara:strand:- start:86 stop:607 length:522 start_codon:yes stop_codon:yes gene_type:complete